MSEQPLRIAMIGAGWAANEHLKVIKALASVDLVGVTSRSEGKARALLGQYGYSCFYKDLVSLLKEAKPEALMVCVSEEAALSVGLNALRSGLPVFFEKPAGLTPAENLRLANEAKVLGVPTMVGFNRRYYSIFHKGMALIKQNGPLLGVAIEGHERFWKVLAADKFSRQVLDNWIFANSTHTIDLLRFFGGDIKDCSSLTHAYKEKNGDQFSAQMKFQNGALGQYHAHWYSPGGWRVVLYGDGVTVEFKPLEAGRFTDKDFKTQDIVPDQVDVDFKAGFYKQMEAFVTLVRTGRHSWPMLDLQGAYQTMRLAEDMTKGVA